MNPTTTHRVLRLTVALAAATAVALLASCDSGGTSDPTAPPTPPTTTIGVVPAPIEDPVSHLTVHGLTGDVISAFESQEVDDCIQRTAELERSDGRIQVSLLAASCGTTVPMNGRHGSYASLTDPAIPTDAAHHTLAIGEAVSFEQTYTEYTNSANEYTEPVVLVRLTDPVDPGFPLVMVVSPTGDLDAAAVLAVASALTVTG